MSPFPPLCRESLQTNVLFNLNAVLKNDVTFQLRHGRFGFTRLCCNKRKYYHSGNRSQDLPIGRGNLSKGKSQAFSYMVENNLLYGIITTQLFLQSEGDNYDQILISETLSFAHNNPTVLKAYAYLALPVAEHFTKF